MNLGFLKHNLPLSHIAVGTFHSLFKAVIENDPQKIKSLIGSGANVNMSATNAGNRRPLHTAIEYRKDSAVTTLIEVKADVTATTQRGFTPLHVAAQIGNERYIKWLIEAKADANALNDAGCTALHEAANAGHTKAVDALLLQGADPTLHEFNYKAKASDLAHKQGHSKIVHLLISAETKWSKNPAGSVTDQKPSKTNNKRGKKGAKTREKDRNESATPQQSHNQPEQSLNQYLLFEAIFYGNIANAKSAIKNGAQVNTICGDAFTMQNRQSLLYLAAHNGNETLVELLIENRSDVNQQVGDGSTPLLVACQKGHLAITKMLLKHNARTDLADNDGEIPIVVAAGFGMTKTVDFLLTKGLDVNTKNKNINAVGPLFMACQAGKIGTVKFLMSHGATIDQARKDGTTPLHIAVFNGHVEVVKCLSEAKADINSKNKEGFTPLSYALEKENDPIIDILLEGMPYQQNFIQHVNYILLAAKKRFLKDSVEEQFIQKLSAITTLSNESDEIFQKINVMLKNPEYEQVKNKLLSLRKALVAQMKKYNEAKLNSLQQLPTKTEEKQSHDGYKYSELVTSTLTSAGLISRQNLNPVDLILEYCNLPVLKM